MNCKQANTQIFKFECTTQGTCNAGLGIQTGSTYKKGCEIE